MASSKRAHHRRSDDEQPIEQRNATMTGEAKTAKNAWWRIQEHMGIEEHADAERHDHERYCILWSSPTRYWYDKPEMLQ